MKIYVQITPQRIRAKRFGGTSSGEWTEDIPLVAVDTENNKPVAYGHDAQNYQNNKTTSQVLLQNPFQNLESLVENEINASNYLSWFFNHHLRNRFALIRPLVVLQQSGFKESLGVLEKRLFKEIIMYAGARCVWLIEKANELSDIDLRTEAYKQ